jgi:site-specific DNA recombinase
VRQALHASHADERREREEAIERFQAEYKRLQHRLDVMYVDKLDGKVDATFYERMSTSWREAQIRCLREIEQHQNASKSCMVEGVRLLELARDARVLFESRRAREKRRLLNFLVSNCSWKAGELTVTLRQPFDLLAKTTVTLEKEKAAGTITNGRSQIWLPGPDSNQRPSG